MKRGYSLVFVCIFLAGCLPRPTEKTITDAEKISTFVAATQTAAPHVEDKTAPITDTPSSPQENTPQPGETATPTFTPTLTSTPTQTSTPTLAAGDPVLSLGPPTFKDTFKDGSNIYLYDEAQSSFQIDDERLMVISKKNNNFETWTLTWGDLRNFYLEITGEFGDE